MLQLNVSWNSEDNSAVNISINRAPAGKNWIVLLGSCQVTFRSELEAVAFVESLKKRIDASHKWASLHSLALA